MPDEIEGREIARGTFCKLDEERRLAFGWASVVSKDGQVIVDSDDDVLDLPSLEGAVYAYVIESRDADEMHILFKRNFALEWQMLLGEPPDGTDEEIANAFRPIAEAPETFAKLYQASPEVSAAPLESAARASSPRGSSPRARPRSPTGHARRVGP